MIVREKVEDERGTWVAWADKRDHYGTPDWYVQLQQERIKTIWGPYDTEEQAMQVSGFPKPKTEVEELWELVEELWGLILQHFGGHIPYHTEDHVVKRVDELRDKWKK